MTTTDLSPEALDRERRLAWFRHARFGMFIHWGLYSLLGRHEWVMNRERIPIPEYETLAPQWKPAPGAPRAWAQLARAAGMRYMVMTTKHHEGFSLWDSRVNPYNAVNYGPGRDLVAEYVAAARAEGLRVGLYYSLGDWHHPDGAICKQDEAARRRFVDYTHALVCELMANYGPIDILWYDGGWPLDAEGWESARLNAMVHALQPDILINNRSHLPEDFGTPEGHITPETGGRAWEACMTFNNSWGYAPSDPDYRTPIHVLEMLRRVAQGHGNLLLNIGPAPDGSVPHPCDAVLLEIGRWMERYGEAIYEATDPMQKEWLYLGDMTCKGSTIYFHCTRWPGSEIAIGGIVNKVLEARFLGGPPIRFTQQRDRLRLHDLPAQAPDPLATVITLKVAGTPRQVMGFGCVLLDEDPWQA